MRNHVLAPARHIRKSNLLAAAQLQQYHSFPSTNLLRAHINHVVTRQHILQIALIQSRWTGHRVKSISGRTLPHDFKGQSNRQLHKLYPVPSTDVYRQPLSVRHTSSATHLIHSHFIERPQKSSRTSSIALLADRLLWAARTTLPSKAQIIPKWPLRNSFPSPALFLIPVSRVSLRASSH